MSNKIEVDEDLFYEMIKFIRAVSEPIERGNGSKYSFVALSNTYTSFIDRLKKYDLDFKSMSEKDLITLGFVKFTTSMKTKLILVPLYLLKLVKKGTVLTSVNDNTVTIGIDHIDKDTRCGCLAYGFRVDELKGQSNGI